MNLDIVVVVLLFLIWAQRSEGIKRLAQWLTRKRRKFMRRVRGG